MFQRELDVGADPLLQEPLRPRVDPAAAHEHPAVLALPLDAVLDGIRHINIIYT